MIKVELTELFKLAEMLLNDGYSVELEPLYNGAKLICRGFNFNDVAISSATIGGNLGLLEGYKGVFDTNMATPEITGGLDAKTAYKMIMKGVR